MTGTNIHVEKAKELANTCLSNLYEDRVVEIRKARKRLEYIDSLNMFMRILLTFEVGHLLQEIDRTAKLHSDKEELALRVLETIQVVEKEVPYLYMTAQDIASLSFPLDKTQGYKPWKAF